MHGRRQFGRIRKLPSGRWQVRYPGMDGRPRTAPKTFQTKAEAGRFLARIESDLDRGVLLDHRLGRVTVGEWAGFMPTTAHLKPKTRASYASLLNATILPVLGDLPLGGLRPLDIQEWASGLAARGLSASRIRQS